MAIMDIKIENITQTRPEIVENLLWPLWRCIEDQYKEKYKREIWEHFENAIKSASYTAKLSMFLTNIQKRIPIVLQTQYMKEVISVIQSANQSEILNWLRDETAYLCAMLRLKNQDRKEQRKAESESDKIDEPNFAIHSETNEVYKDQSDELINL